MKKYLPLLALLITGCASPLGSLGRAFPDGSSFTIEEVNIQASMTGSGSMVLKGVTCVGTNGFPLGATNAPGAIAQPTTILPSGTFIRVK